MGDMSGNKKNMQELKTEKKRDKNQNTNYRKKAEECKRYFFKLLGG